MTWLVAVQLLAAFICALISALYVAPYLIAVAKKLNFLDIPQGALKQHKEPVPYLGGLVVYLGLLISLILFFPFETQSVYFLLGSTLLLVVGLIDDCVPLRPYQKFVGQLVAVICFARGGLYMKGVFFEAQQYKILAYLVWIPVSCFWMLSIINAFNLVDIMDGLAAVTALAAASGFFVIALLAHAYPVALLLAAFIGALIGFLWYNKPPARLYLGDAGSLFIGGVLCTVPFMIPWGTFSWYGYLAPIAILMVPELEIGALVFIRTALGIRFYHGSPHHFKHFLMSYGWGVKKILAYVVLYSTSVFTITVAFLTGKISLTTFCLACGLLAIGWYVVLGGYGFLKNKVVALFRKR